MKKKSDQWLLDGECDKCRRNKYCRKSCKASMTHRNLEMKIALARGLYKALNSKRER